MELEQDPTMHAYRQRVNPAYRAFVRAEGLRDHETGLAATRARLMAGMGMATPEAVPVAVKPEAVLEDAADVAAAIAFAEAAQEPPDDGAPLYYAEGVPVYGDEDEEEQYDGWSLS